MSGGAARSRHPSDSFKLLCLRKPIICKQSHCRDLCLLSYSWGAEMLSFGLVSLVCFLGCSDEPDDTVTVSVRETSGTIEAFCYLKGDDWQMILVGSRAIRLSYQSNVRSAYSWNCETGTPKKFRSAKGTHHRPSPGGSQWFGGQPKAAQCKRRLAATLMEHPKHLAIQIRCETPQYSEFDVLERDVVFRGAPS
jgi:hypothetical protein